MEPSHEIQKDEEVVRLALTQKEYFAVLIERYEEKLRRYIHRLSRLTREEGEDLLQDIFLKVYTNLNDFDRGLSFSSWIYRIAHNEAISMWRKKSVRPHGHYVDVDDAHMQRIAAACDLARIQELKDFRDRIETILETMDEKYRIVIILRFFEDKDYNEIADILKKPRGTVSTLLNRAKKKLKDACGEMELM